MRAEVILPVLLGLVAVVIGGVLLLDAIVPDGSFVPEERRRGDRPPRSQLGEGLLGAAIVLLGASLIGRDSWPYTTLSVLLAVALGGAGVAMNWRYLREMAVAPQRRSGESFPPNAEDPRRERDSSRPADESSTASLG
ncbi:MAG: hypothetical protein ACR2HZ_03775 [Gemmatimonadaceae bacterium]